MSPRPPRRLLIVEDDDVLRGRLARAFRERGFEVREAADAASAARQARGEPPSHALVDLRLPDTSGLEVVRALIAADRATAVVVLTGYGSIATALEAVRLGARHYLTKPADVDEILSAFDRDPSSARSRTLRRSRAWPAWSGSTSTACSPTAAATSPKRRVSSGSTGDRSSASSPSSPPRADRGQNAFEIPKRKEKRAPSCASFTCWYAGTSA